MKIMKVLKRIMPTLFCPLRAKRSDRYFTFFIHIRNEHEKLLDRSGEHGAGATKVSTCCFDIAPYQFTRHFSCHVVCQQAYCLHDALI
jgi:hypothetical protein